MITKLPSHTLVIRQLTPLSPDDTLFLAYVSKTLGATVALMWSSKTARIAKQSKHAGNSQCPVINRTSSASTDLVAPAVGHFAVLNSWTAMTHLHLQVRNTATLTASA